ncbi:MAG TPA: ABC transporter substrate-binding protein [Pseudolabrys sp.]|nr:ABC transporter substrate-binding protein [Pseudolabrys sp.]
MKVLKSLSLALVGFSLVAASAGTASAADLIRLGEGPFITGGGFFVARAKGYFAKMGIELQTKSYTDGAMAVPSLLSGEIDITGTTANAALFNSVAKGAQLVLVLDHGNNKVGRAYTAMNVSMQMYNAGVKSMADFAKLKGKRIGLGATGSINQYTIAKALQKAGLDPRKDVTWITNVPQPDLMKMLGQNEVDATDLAYQFAYFAQQNKWGPIVAVDDEIDPDGNISIIAARKDFIKNKRDVLVRFAMAYLQGVKEFDAAAEAPDKHEDIVKILAESTFLKKPELVKAIAPHWSYTSEDGAPNVKSVMAMQDYWSDYFHYVEKKVTAAQLFDLSIAKEAKARLDKEHPFN